MVTDSERLLVQAHLAAKFRLPPLKEAEQADSRGGIAAEAKGQKRSAWSRHYYTDPLAQAAG